MFDFSVYCMYCMYLTLILLVGPFHSFDL